MRFANLAHKLFCTPLLVLPTTYATFERALLQRMGMPFDGQAVDPWASRVRARKDEDDAPPEAQAVTPAEKAQRRVNRILSTHGSVAVISIDGVIDKRMSDSELDCYGGVDLNDVDAAIAQVAEDSRIRRVVFDFNTPGGSSAGVAETAARIRQLGAYKNAGGASKETRARVELLCCSAGQWLAAQCDFTDATPSATLGSIGVYCALLDQTGWLEQMGLKVNLMKAGKYKAMGASFKELEDEERAMLQASVDTLWKEFKNDVRQGRGDVAEESMQGQSFRADEAKRRGLVDNLDASSLDEYVAALR